MICCIFSINTEKYLNIIYSFEVKQFKLWKNNYIIIINSFFFGFLSRVWCNS